jgi:hypothetical protein
MVAVIRRIAVAAPVMKNFRITSPSTLEELNGCRGRRYVWELVHIKPLAWTKTGRSRLPGKRYCVAYGPSNATIR